MSRAGKAVQGRCPMQWLDHIGCWPNGPHNCLRSAAHTIHRCACGATAGDDGRPLPELGQLSVGDFVTATPSPTPPFEVHGRLTTAELGALDDAVGRALAALALTAAAARTDRLRPRSFGGATT